MLVEPIHSSCRVRIEHLTGGPLADVFLNQVIIINSFNLSPLP